MSVNSRSILHQASPSTVSARRRKIEFKVSTREHTLDCSTFEARPSSFEREHRETSRVSHDERASKSDSRIVLTEFLSRVLAHALRLIDTTASLSCVKYPRFSRIPRSY